MRWCVLVLGLCASAASAGDGPKFLSPDDGWVDLGDFLDKPYGFVPLIVPITEPAIGFGAGAGLVFIDRTTLSENNHRPNMALVGGALTTRGTWAGAGGYTGSYLDGKLRVMGGLAFAGVNLDWYGLGDGPAQTDPLQYTIDVTGYGVGVAYQLGNSPFFVGLMQGVAATSVSARGANFDEKQLGDTILSVLRPSLQVDTRDSVFTPAGGFFAEVSLTGFFEGFRTSGRVDVVGIVYVPLLERLTLGVRTDFGTVLGDPPFYLSPFVQLRGAPIMRYAGQQMADMELEFRWQFWKRLSLVAFGGFGGTLSTTDYVTTAKVVFAGGGGVRYELSRRHNLHMGIDVAGSAAGPAFYLVFGSAWSRL
jgi:outer membrane protein assembly factor BamA